MSILLLVLVLLHAASREVGAQPTGVLTLAQAVDEALVKNDRLIDQHDTTEHAELGLRLARNAFQPKVVPNILGSFGQTNVSAQTYRVDLAQRFTTGTEVRLGVGTATAQIPGLPGGDGDIRFYNADTTLTLSQPLLKGFGRNAARRSLTSAELRRADAGRQQTLAEQQVAIEVVSAYDRVVAQEGFVQVAEQSLKRARHLRDASEAKLDAGLVSQLDVLRAHQLVSQSETQFFDARSATEDARDQLLFLMGREAGDAFEVVADIPAPSDAPIDVAAATTIALTNRLDIQSRAAENADAERYPLRPQSAVAAGRRQSRVDTAADHRLVRAQFRPRRLSIRDVFHDRDACRSHRATGRVPERRDRSRPPRPRAGDDPAADC